MPDPRTISIAQSIYASVAHRYWNTQWSVEKNQLLYGSDCSEEGMGSNLRIEARLTGPSDLADTVLLEPLMRLKAMVDHSCLFAAHTAFDAKPSTLENIAAFLGRELFAEAPSGGSGEWESLTVWESANLACTVTPSTRVVTLGFQVRNLFLHVRGEIDPESGLVEVRHPVNDAVNDIFSKSASAGEMPLEEWSSVLFQTLKGVIKNLSSLRIDLGRHEYLLVHSKS